MTWTERVAPGVEAYRHRAQYRLAHITNEAELAATAGLIEEMAARLDRARVAVQSAGVAVLLLALGAYGALQ
jgi:hypothetical protein